MSIEEKAYLEAKIHMKRVDLSQDGSLAGLHHWLDLATVKS